MRFCNHDILLFSTSPDTRFPYVRKAPLNCRIASALPKGTSLYLVSFSSSLSATNRQWVVVSMVIPVKHQPAQSLVHVPHPPLREAAVICLHVLHRMDFVEGSVKLERRSPNVSLLELLLCRKFDLSGSRCPLPSRFRVLLFVGGLVNVFSFFFNPALRL
jgi:hypothetical protein